MDRTISQYCIKKPVLKKPEGAGIKTIIQIDKIIKLNIAYSFTAPATRPFMRKVLRQK